jgi:hypothetical protein
VGFWARLAPHINQPTKVPVRVMDRPLVALIGIKFILLAVRFIHHVRAIWRGLRL